MTQASLNTTPRSGIVKGFFHDLFDLYDGGHIELRAIRPKWKKSGRRVLRALVSSVDRAVHWVHDILQPRLEYDLYFGVLPRFDGVTTKDGVKSSSAVWVDIDVTELGMRSRVYHRVKSDLMPTHIVDSGRGLHVYWLLNEVVEDMGLVEGTNYLLAKHFGADLACIDRTRILRVPTSTHWKEKDHPKQVRLIHTSGQRYGLQEIRERVEGLLGGAGVEPFRTIHMGSDSCRLLDITATPVSRDKISRLSGWQYRFLVDGIKADGKGFYDGDRSRLDYYFARWCGQAGFTSGEVAWCLMNPDFGISAKTLSFDSLGERGRYVRRTVYRAFEDIGKEIESDDSRDGLQA